MADLTIRNVPEDVVERLRLRAARAGRSLEAEALSILTEASQEAAGHTAAADLDRWVDELYGQSKPTGVVDELIAARRREASATGNATR